MAAAWSRTCKGYEWTQTKDAMSVEISTNGLTKSKKDITVTIEKRNLSVRVAGNVLCEGIFPKEKNVQERDSVWFYEDGIVTVELVKTKCSWWDRLFASESPLDVSEMPAIEEPDAAGTSRLPRPEMKPIGKLGEQSETRDTFKGSSTFQW